MLKHPKFDHILSGCTSLRLLELATSLPSRNLIKGVEVCDIPVAEARAAREMMLIGSSIKVAPVVEWDQRLIGDGKPGPVARALRELLQDDRSEERRVGKEGGARRETAPREGEVEGRHGEQGAKV